MKYVSIALLFFLIHVSAALISATGIFGVGIQTSDEWFEAVDNNELADADYTQGTISTSSVNFGFGDFIKGLWYFVKAVGLGVIAVPYTLAAFGLKSPFIYYFSVPIYFIYMVGLAQFIANRSMKSMT